MTSPIPHRLISPFGAEVDLDLSADLSDEIIEELKALYDRHHLLVFRDQALSHPRQIEFLSSFGPPLLNPQDGVGYISNQPGKGGLGGGELAFHSDLAFSPEPFLGISLHAIDVENERSSTRFVDSCLSYRDLPEATRARLDGLNALHVFAIDMAGHNSEDVPEDMPRSIHPLIMEHPRTGEPILYMNLNQTARIVELEPEESRELIEELFDHLYRPENIYEHRWRMGDFVMWDNLAAQHARGEVSNVGPRTLQRVVLARKGFFEQHPEFSMEQFAT
jgi:alpha-ketoglutarate-dependent taurine dioxygenase